MLSLRLLQPIITSNACTSNASTSCQDAPLNILHSDAFDVGPTPDPRGQDPPAITQEPVALFTRAFAFARFPWGLGRCVGVLVRDWRLVALRPPPQLQRHVS